MSKKKSATAVKDPETNEKYSAELDRFFRHETEDEYEIILYRILQKKTKKKKYYVDSWESEPPSNKEIAIIHGPGEYKFFAIDPGTNEPRTKTLNIGDEWQLAHEKYLKEQEELTKPAKVPADSQHVDPFDQLDKLSKIIERMLPKQPANPFSEMPSFISSMGKSYFESMSSAQDRMLEMTLSKIEKANDQPEQGEPPMEENQGLKKEIVDLFVHFFKTMLNAKGKEKEKIKKMIEKDKRFKKVQADSKLFSGIYTDLCKEKKVGKTIADKVFKKYGFSVPK